MFLIQKLQWYLISIPQNRNSRNVPLGVSLGVPLGTVLSDTPGIIHPIIAVHVQIVRRWLLLRLLRCLQRAPGFWCLRTFRTKAGAHLDQEVGVHKIHTQNLRQNNPDGAFAGSRHANQNYVVFCFFFIHSQFQKCKRYLFVVTIPKILWLMQKHSQL